MFSVIFVAASFIFALETLGDPPGELAEYNKEAWTLLSSFYFIFVTISTVGYGDLYPVTGLRGNDHFASFHVYPIDDLTSTNSLS